MASKFNQDVLWGRFSSPYLLFALTSDKNNDIMVYKKEKSVKQNAAAVGVGVIASVSAKIYIDNLGW